MPWVICFIASWILFFLLVDYKKLKRNWIGGVIALLMATVVDYAGSVTTKSYDFIAGATRRNRTADLRITSALLYRLSHGGVMLV